jgi:hypothetical protein
MSLLAPSPAWPSGGETGTPAGPTPQTDRRDLERCRADQGQVKITEVDLSPPRRSWPPRAPRQWARGGTLCREAEEPNPLYYSEHGRSSARRGERRLCYAAPLLLTLATNGQ